MSLRTACASCPSAATTTTQTASASGCSATRWAAEQGIQGGLGRAGRGGGACRNSALAGAAWQSLWLAHPHAWLTLCLSALPACVVVHPGLLLLQVCCICNKEVLEEAKQGQAAATAAGARGSGGILGERGQQ
jgi:hypothetical protein